MTNINTDIFNATVQRDHYTMRLARNYANTANKQINTTNKPSISLLNARMEDIKEAIENNNGRVNRNITSDIRQLARDITELREQKFTPALEQLADNIEDFADLEVTAQNRIYNSPFNDLPITLALAGATVAATLQLYRNQPIPLSRTKNVIIPRSIQNLPQAESDRVLDTLTNGFRDNDSNSEIRRRVQSQFSVTNNSVEMLSRTAITAIAQFAVDQIGESNSGFIRGWRNVSVIDNRTSSICREAAAKYKNTVYANKNSITPVPRHPSCRSRIVPVFLPLSDLGLAIVGGVLTLTPDTGQTAAEKNAIMRDAGLTAAEMAAIKNQLTSEIPPANIDTVLNNASDRFLRDWFQNEAAYIAFVTGALTIQETIDSEDKSFLTREEIEEKVNNIE